MLTPMPGFYDAAHPWPGVPNPGSDDARGPGCVCPGSDNEWGELVGGMGFYISLKCPLHGRGRVSPLPSKKTPTQAFRGIRRRLVERAGPFLEPGEQARHALLVRHGPNPLLTSMSVLLGTRIQFYGLIVTDRAVVVLDLDLADLRIVGPVCRLPRHTRLSVRRGFPFARGELDGKRIWIHPRFIREARAIDQAAT